MAGFREFLTGEVLTAANVNNFLMKQSVMVFADAAARTAALGAEVAEGMLTYNEDTEQLEVFDGAAFVLAAPAPPAGIGSNVVQTVKTDTFTTTSTSYVDVTDLTVTITPSTATAKVLVLATLQISDSAAAGVFVELQRAGTTIFIGDAAGNRVRASGMATGSASALGYTMNSVTLATVDSPATASATIYKIRMRTDSSTGTLNRFGLDNDNSSVGRVASSIIVIEVAP